MSDDKKDNDLTRIEDLSEYLHAEDDEVDFSGLSTDPDLSLPDEFIKDDTTSDNETDFDSLEESLLVEDELVEDEMDDNENESFADDNSFESDSFSSDDSSDDENIDEEIDFNANSDFNEDESADFDSVNFETVDSEDETSFDSDSFNDEGFEDDFSNDDNSDDNSKDEIELESAPETDSDLDENEFLENDFSDDFDSKESDEENTSQEIEETEEKQEIPAIPVPISQEYRAPENFKDLQKFSKNMSYGNLSHEGTPPFSIVLKDIKYEEDLNDIIILLKEFKILTKDDEENAKKTLSRGSFLIPRLSEYAAILLCHKLRRFELTILMGLTEEITPAKSYSSDDSGLATKNNIYNNRSHNWMFEQKELNLSDILTSTSQTLENYEIKEYISLATEFSIIDSEVIENAESVQVHVYNDLVEKLKSHALNKKGNGVVGINYTLTTLVKDNADSSQQYKVTCTGNIVWLLRR